VKAELKKNHHIRRVLSVAFLPKKVGICRKNDIVDEQMGPATRIILFIS